MKNDLLIFFGDPKPTPGLRNTGPYYSLYTNYS